MKVHEKLHIVNAMVELARTGAVSTGTIGKLMGDKGEMLIAALTGASIGTSNQPGYDLLTENGDRIEVKTRRKTMRVCHVRTSKKGKFNKVAFIWYDAETLRPSAAYFLDHDSVWLHQKGEIAYIKQLNCMKHGTEILESANSGTALPCSTPLKPDRD
ncbi:DUF6998 domain-containing protein [Vibrio mediterranei]